jgi:group I intron endonuclease
LYYNIQNELLHVGRGLYYGSYKTPRILVWSIGVIILILMMAIAFLGYDNSLKCSNFNNNKYNKYNKMSLNKIKIKKFPFFHNFHIKNNKNPIYPFAGYNEIYKIYPYSTVASTVNNEKSKVLIDFLIDTNLNPIYSYENLQLESTKKTIIFDTKDLSGIYLILNKITLDYYVGSASTGRFYARLTNHLFNFHGSKILKLAVKKYNISEFAFLILELFPEIVNKENNKKLLDLEDFYLKSLLPNYNILTEAGSSFGYKHTEMTRLKMKSNYSLKRRQLIGHLNKDTFLDPNTIEKRVITALTKQNRVLSEEGKVNLTQKSKAVLLYNLDYTVYGEYPSILEAARSVKCANKTIRRALNTDKKLLKRRWIVKYV